MSVTGPGRHELVTVSTEGGGHYLWFDADLDNFTLGEITPGYAPCSALIDTGKGDGQHVYVVIDDGPGRVASEELPIKVPITHYNDSGPHTLRAFLSRSWDECLKDVGGVTTHRETNLYCVRTFYIGDSTGTDAVDSTLPLLTLDAPLEASNWTYPSNEVPLDFALTFAEFSNGYAVEATLMDSTENVLHRDTLTQWVPYCITGLEDPPVGRLRKYLLHVRVLDEMGSPVANGGDYNLNDVLRTFNVTQHN